MRPYLNTTPFPLRLVLLLSSCSTVSGHRGPFEAGSDRDPLLPPVLLSQPPTLLSTCHSHLLLPFQFLKATCPEAEEVLKTIPPVILGTFLKH